MKINYDQERKEWLEAFRKAYQLPRSVIWGIRIALVLLVLVWVGGAVYLHSIVKEDERQLAQIQQAQQLKEERLRREASYRQSLEQQKRPQSRVQNAVDGVK